MALTRSLESLSMPILRAIRSIFLVEAPFAHDSATAAATARSAREQRSIMPSGKWAPALSLGMRGAMSPTGVARPRSRYPLRALAPSPHSMSACASITSLAMDSSRVRAGSLMSRSPSPWVGSCREVSIAAVAFLLNPFRGCNGF